MFEQERVLVRLQQRILQDQAVMACFLAGSFGRRTEDGYSDLDVVLVYDDEMNRDIAWDKRRDFVQSAMPYVPAKSFDADHVRPFLHVALYSNGSKADYLYETKESLRPNPYHKSIRILKDKADWAENYQTACQTTAVTQPHISLAELTTLDNRFWVMYWDVLRQVLRGDHQKPFTVYLELMYFALPPLLRVLPPEDPTHAHLLQASFSKDTKTTAVHLKQLLTAYLEARTAVNRRLNLGFMPNSSFENGITQIVKRKA